MKIRLYEISLSTSPFTAAESKVIARYKDPSHAERIGSFVTEILSDVVEGGLSYSIHELEEASDDFPAHNDQRLSNKDFSKILSYASHQFKSEMIPPAIPTPLGGIKQVETHDVYAVIMSYTTCQDIDPVTLGCYHYETTAQKVVSFIANCHPQGIGTENSFEIIKHRDTCLQLTCERMFVILSQKIHEICLSSGSVEFLRVYKIAQEATHLYQTLHSPSERVFSDVYSPATSSSSC